MQRKNNLLLAYLVVFLKLSMGFITYPLVLHYLSGIELSIYFLFIGTTSLFELLDFNFTNNLVRYFSYAAAGINKLDQIGNNSRQSSGIGEEKNLFTNLLLLSRLYYKFMCLVGFLVIGVGFSIYLYFFTVKHNYTYSHLELSWVIYCSASLLGVYFMYYSPLLIGKGYIDSVNKISLVSKIAGVFFQIIGLVMGLGILALAISALATTTLERMLLYTVMKAKNFIEESEVYNKQQFLHLFKQIWQTNYKLGLMSLSWLLISKVNSFIAGFAINDINLLNNYLFTSQIIMILLAVAHVPVSNNFSDISALYVTNKVAAMNLFLQANRKSLLLMFALLMLMFIFGNYGLGLLNLHCRLLSSGYLLLICVTYLCEKQVLNHTTMITVRDEVPMFKAYLFSAFGVLFLTVIMAFVLHLSLISFILPQLLVQGLFNYWFWVKYNLALSNITFTQYYKSVVMK